MEENRGSSSHHQELQISFGMLMNKEGGGAYDLGVVDQALLLYLDGQDQYSSSVEERKQTLNIFPSQPMHVEPSNKGGINLAPPSNTSSMEVGNSRSNISSLVKSEKDNKKEFNAKKGTTNLSIEQEGPKAPDAKILRRLAQNREAAKKCRLRKKAYVQQLEHSRIRLSQLEQELQRARAQGVFFGGGPIFGEQGLSHGFNNLSSDAAIFDMEHARWVEEHHRLICELRAVVHEQLPEHKLRLYVDNCLSHYDEMMNLKSVILKADVFHLISGIWKSPVERCFMWMGGFRPSDLIKILMSHIEPLTEQQIVGICRLQQSTQETEEALSQGLEALYRSLSDTIASDSLISCPSNMANYMGQMAIAMNKLSTVEGFVRQADGLRHQTLHRLHQIITVRQAARCFLALAEYFHCLQALSSLWLARPKT